MRFVIHSCDKRKWYVNDFLIPIMVGQGINGDDIVVWNDDGGRMGNLESCMRCFEWCGKNDVGGSWHLQDDVLICADFYKRAKENDSGIVCGFCNIEFGPSVDVKGRVPAAFAWNSFQCIRIPDTIAGECADWFYNEAMTRADTDYQTKIAARKHDDGFYRDFLIERHSDIKCLNLVPNLVEHVDFLVGGSVINMFRGHTSRAFYWQDENRVENLKQEIQNYNATRA